MPITTSAKKALRQSLRRKTHNIIYEKKIKDLVKQARKKSRLAKLIAKGNLTS